MADTEINWLKDSVNSDEDIVPGYRFLLRVEGFQDVPLKSIRPFSQEKEYETIQEGGLNDYVHSVRKAASKPFTLVVERYVNQKFVDPLANGTNFLLPLILFVGSADAVDFDFKPVRTYAFTGCSVMNKEVNGFDAEKSGLLTETVTILYQNSYAIQTPVSVSKTPWKFEKGKTKTDYADSQKGLNIAQNNDRKAAFEKKYQENLWSFDTAKNYKGKGKRYANEQSNDAAGAQKTISKEDSEALATRNRWEFDKKKPAGNGKISADADNASKPKDLATAKQMAKKNLWSFDGKKVKGKGKRNATPEDVASKPESLDAAQAQAAKNTWNFGKSREEYEGVGPRHALKLSQFLPQKVSE